MQVQLNSQPFDIEEHSTLIQLLEQIKKANKTGIAIALNGTVIAKSQWEQTKLSVNDTITIITATQGG